jgi:amidase
VLAVVALVAGLLVGAGHIATPASAPSDCLALVGGVDLHAADVTELQRAMTAGVLTSAQLVDAYRARIAALDGRLVSVRMLNPDARRQAALLDAERAAGRVRGPLHGIPVLLKDNIGTHDMPTTAGSIALAGNRPPLDASFVERLRAAGAVILGKTNLSEFANWVAYGMPNGYSSLGGQVVNAYNDGDPLGSSSGSGVAASMAFAALTVGTETSGSIIAPADVNSVVGIKPTVGLVSRGGVIPLAPSFDTAGPMTRSVRDAALLLGAMAGYDPNDRATEASREAGHMPPGRDYTTALRPDALHGVRIGYLPGGGDVYTPALEDLEDLGATLVPVDALNGAVAFNLLAISVVPNEFKAGINDYLARHAGPGLPVHDLSGIIAYNRQHPDKVKYGQNLLVASNLTPGIGFVGPPQAAPIIEGAQAFVDGMLSTNDVDVLVGPSYFLTFAGAAAGYPVVSVPAGYVDRTPEGITFLGTAWSEPALLGYAYAYEQATHRRVPPPVINPKLVAGACG